MADPLQHVVPGDPLSIEARTWNAILDTVKRTRPQPRPDGGGGAPRGDGGAGAAGGLLVGPATHVLVKNTTGGAIANRAVLTPSAFVFDPSDRPEDAAETPRFIVSAPVTDADVVLIATDLIRDGRYGRAVVTGVTVASVVITDTNHRYARPAPGDLTSLHSAETGQVRLLQTFGETGTYLCYVLLQDGGPELSDATPPPGGSGGGGGNPPACDDAVTPVTATASAGVVSLSVSPIAVGTVGGTVTLATCPATTLSFPLGPYSPPNPGGTPLSVLTQACPVYETLNYLDHNGDPQTMQVVTSIANRRIRISAAVSDERGCLTVAESCCGGSGGSGSTPIEKCTKAVTGCEQGTSSLLELFDFATGELVAVLYHVTNPSDGNTSRYVSSDLTWDLRPSANVWILTNTDTGEQFVAGGPGLTWDCGDGVAGGVNTFASLETNTILVTEAVYSCANNTGYDCGDGRCIGVPLGVATYTSLPLCLAGCAPGATTYCVGYAAELAQDDASTWSGGAYTLTTDGGGGWTLTDGTSTWTASGWNGAGCRPFAPASLGVAAVTVCAGACYVPPEPPGPVTVACCDTDIPGVVPFDVAGTGGCADCASGGVTTATYRTDLPDGNGWYLGLGVCSGRRLDGLPLGIGLRWHCEGGLMVMDVVSSTVPDVTVGTRLTESGGAYTLAVSESCGLGAGTLTLTPTAFTCTPPSAPPIVTSCGTVSASLKVTYSTGEVFVITHNGTEWVGTFGAAGCGTGHKSLSLLCTAGTWSVAAVASWEGPTSVAVTPTTTSPFLLNYTGAESGLCGGAVTFTVEEL
jgi:hypothetical protein